MSETLPALVQQQDATPPDDDQREREITERVASWKDELGFQIHKDMRFLVARLAQLRKRTQALDDEIGFWRRETISRLWFDISRYRQAEKAGASDMDLAAIRAPIRSALAAFDQADEKQWFERCMVCGEFLRPGQEITQAGGIDQQECHSECVGHPGHVSGDDLESGPSVIQEARQICNPGSEDEIF